MDDSNTTTSLDTPAESNTLQNDSEGQAQLLLSLEQLIKSTIRNLETLGTELSEKRQMFADSFENDATFKEIEDKAKEATKVKLQTKQQIVKQPSIAQIALRIKDIAQEMRERKSTLSEYLLEYLRITGVNQIEAEDGVVHEIVHVAKLVKQTPKSRK